MEDYDKEPVEPIAIRSLQRHLKMETDHIQRLRKSIAEYQSDLEDAEAELAKSEAVVGELEAAIALLRGVSSDEK